jgi:hypothetical protein
MSYLGYMKPEVNKNNSIPLYKPGMRCKSVAPLIASHANITAVARKNQTRAGQKPKCRRSKDHCCPIANPNSTQTTLAFPLLSLLATFIYWHRPLAVPFPLIGPTTLQYRSQSKFAWKCTSIFFCKMTG